MRQSSAFALAFVFIGLIVGLMSLGGVDTRTSALGSTPRPSPTASTTPAPSLELPDWVTDPTLNVFLAFTYTEEETYPVRPTIINVDTGERFYVDWSHVHSMHWIEVDGRLYLRLDRHRSSGADNSDGFLEFVDTTSHELTRYTLDDLSRPDRQIELPAVDNDNGNGFHYEISDDGQVSIVSLEGIVQLEIPPLTADYRQIEATWHGDYLHVWYWDYIDMYSVERGDMLYGINGDILMTFVEGPPFWANNESRLLFRSEDSQFCLYDLGTTALDCDLFTAWETELGANIVSVAWTPDNEEILVFYRIGASADGGLCRYLITDGNMVCIWEHTLDYGPFSAGPSTWLDDDTLIFGYRNVVDGNFDTGNLRDSGMCILELDRSAIECPTFGVLPAETYYNYHAISPSRTKFAIMYTGQEYAGQDGMCIYDVETAVMECLVNPDDLGGGYIEEVDWSPDGRHIALMYGPYGPLSDDKSFTKLGFVDVESGTYRDEGYAYLEHNLSALWRP